ncbi:MAG: type II toxin-antitoxin system HicB family antitoxin [Deltaproteobacteria bacterium]|nr:type II toxin-antitoxin system HicB family antitoxin [Deltaproteobacteria bacterium]
MKKYLVVIEESKIGYSAFSPDLPGCIATGASLVEVKKNMQKAIEFHLEGLKLEDNRPPEPHCQSAYVEVAA